MGVEPQKLPRPLVDPNPTGFDACLSRFFVKPLNDGEDKSAYLRKQTAGWAPPCGGSRNPVSAVP